MPTSDYRPTQPDFRAWGLAVLLVLLWALVLTALLTPEIPNGHGFQHSKFLAMDQGGDGVLRHESLLLIGWLLGSVVIALFVFVLTWGTVGETSSLGARRRRPGAGRADLRWLMFLLGGLAYEIVFGLMCYAYRQSLIESEVAFLGPFPAGVSLQVFGVWLTPWIFIVFYVIFFNQWIMPPESRRRFADLAAQASRSGEAEKPREG